ncbi:unnamed protein product [Auanema sp. JU1783]|nr:unnamed protein product [Auanema sp. JU1783]
MDPINDARFYESLIKLPDQRTSEDVRNIYDQLRQLEMFANLYDAPLKAICASARYERHSVHHVLFRQGQVATCWYILLSGSVLIDGNVCLPYGCFGKRNSLNYRRSQDCICLHEAEMIVIDYPDVAQNNSVRLYPNRNRPPVHSAETDALIMPPPPIPPPRPPRLPRPSDAQNILPRSYPVNDFPVDVPSTSFPIGTDIQSRGGKSQVFINGSCGDEDTLRVKHRREKSNSMGSSQSSAAARRNRVRSTASSTTTEGEELGGEPVDSDEEDDGSCPSHESFLDLRDSVRECLEKEPSERNAEDLAVLLDFMQHMSAFAALPMTIKRQLCLKMVFAVVNDAGTVVMYHNEKLDSWSVIVNGLVEVVKPNGDRVEYKLGDSFGAEPVPTVQYHVGEMRTLVDDCEFVLVEHKDFCSIMSTMSEHIEKDRDGTTGEVTAEHERRTLGSQSGAVIIKAKPDRLIQHLVEDRDKSLDPHYVEDFLLTYRVFVQDPTQIFEKLMLLFADAQYRDKVARVILLWVNNHFNDFETNDDMMKLLDRFEGALERDNMNSQQSLLNIACSVKARQRTISYKRSNKDEPLNFKMASSKDSAGGGVFISDVIPDTTAERAGLKRGDEILEVNNQNMKFISTARAEELITGSLSVNIVVKSNIFGFKELLERTERDINGPKTRTKSLAGTLCQSRNSIPSVIPVKTPKIVKMMGTKTSMMDKILTMLKSSKDDEFIDEIGRTSSELRSSRSNPDIASLSQYYGPVKRECPEHVLKIYRGDQSFKMLPVYKETTAQNVVQLALQEFGMTAEGSLEWSLSECTVTENKAIVQRKLPPQLDNLAERIGLNSRYYLKNNNRSEPLIPDSLAAEVLKEAQSTLLMLNAHVVAAQLTLQDFSVFSSIEPTEYIDNLFQLNSRYGSPRLHDFEQLFNREMWWVATEICREISSQKRTKLIKKFIKIARHCRELRNFNSMFAIMSGLDKPAVRRMHTTWEKVPGKYMRMLEDIQQLVDPSRNMSKYRQHLAEVSQEPPVVPIYPIIKKDLTFTHEGNPTYVDKLVNFEKLRLIGKAVHIVTKLSSVPYELSSMAERSGGTINDALIHMNNFENGNVATMRKGGRVNNQQPKKVYEQALMVRKVKAYLSDLKVIDNEAELDRLSYHMEPAQATMKARRAPSPSPSSLSSQSTGSTSTEQRRFMGTKFGVQSPQAVEKMFSLVHSSKVKEVAPSPSSSPASGRLQRNVPRVTPRQSSASSIHRMPSFKQEAVDLNQETSAVTTFHGKDSSSSASSSACSSPSVYRNKYRNARLQSSRSSYPAGNGGVLLGHRVVPHFTPSNGVSSRNHKLTTILDSNLLNSEQVSRV